MRILLWIFVVIPVIEIWLLIQIGGRIGALLTLAWLVLAAVIGINLVRYQGVATMMRIRKQLQAGEAPARAVIDGMMIGIAGILLIIPGFASDIMALLLLIPTVRHLLLSHWVKKMRVKTASRGNIYEGEMVEPDVKRPERIEHTLESGQTLEGEFRKDEPGKSGDQ